MRYRKHNLPIRIYWKNKGNASTNYKKISIDILTYNIYNLYLKKITIMGKRQWSENKNDNISIWNSIFTQREIIKNYPWVSQALWLVPIFWAGKNLFETLAIWKDSITNRKFTSKEQLFKTLSGLCALSSWWIVWYNSYYEKELFETIVMISSLQIINWTSYITGVYYSWELQKILQHHKDNMSKNTQNIISTTKKIKETTQSIIRKHSQEKK